MERLCKATWVKLGSKKHSKQKKILYNSNFAKRDDRNKTEKVIKKKVRSTREEEKL